MKVFAGKTVIVTGHTGFKGSWLSLWLSSLGAEVVGFSNGIPSCPSNYESCSINEVVKEVWGDIRDDDAVNSLIKLTKPDYVFHLAAKSLVRPSFKSPIVTFTTNAIGSAILLEALRKENKPVTVVMITSDKAYDNQEWVWGYRENDRLGGSDPYSASKGMAELAIRAYKESYFNDANSNVRLGIARAGNVIGGGDWAMDRLVPDCVKAWSKNEIVEVRNPDSTRPWQHVLEPLSGYLSLAAQLANSSGIHGESYNFGPSSDNSYSVIELIEEMARTWPSVRWRVASDREEIRHESGLLKLNCDKALQQLSWVPTLGFSDTVRMTVDWYQKYFGTTDSSIRDFTFGQIEEYMKLARSKDVSWGKI